MSAVASRFIVGALAGSTSKPAISIGEAPRAPVPIPAGRGSNGRAYHFLGDAQRMIHGRDVEELDQSAAAGSVAPPPPETRWAMAPCRAASSGARRCDRSE